VDKTIGISELRKSLAEKVKDVHKNHTRYVIVQRSQARAVLMSPEELELLDNANKGIIPGSEGSFQGPSSVPRSSSYDEFFGKQKFKRE
jgi:prevent-host-death family protein